MARNRRQLSDELSTYGYVFSLKKAVVRYALVIAGLFILGRFFGLHLIPQIVLFVAGMIVFPLLLRNTYRNRYYQQKFSDLNIYMEQFLYSFMKSRKVLTTLEDTYDLFEEGDMKKTIGKAIDHIKNTYNESDFEEKALKIIEKNYPYEGLTVMHRFALRTETLGGEYGESIELLLESRRMWADRIYSLQQEKKTKRREIVLSIATSLLLCSMIYYMSGRLNLDVSANPLAQIITVVVLILDLLIYYRADSKLTAGYLATEKNLEKEHLKQYERYQKYGKGPLSALGKRTARKNIQEYIKACFPEWLMQMSLLMQAENVQVAIFKSYDEAPAILKPALKEMIGRLRLDPNDKKAYTDFLSEFTLPEVRSTMKMLYSISEGKGGEARGQIADIIRRNQEMSDKAKRQQNSDSLAGMYALFLAPQLTGGLKLICDMVLLFAVYMGNMSGGVV
ncbi:MAG: hypothetical protein PUC40_01350 [Lachnospiraceae bacterium]|nr:hypothetical protein [Lachnospiraceae bacterium]MDD5955615.1 hypothetical protein [Lachnospiraceae bacterium]